jgi:hypothetical protein
VTQERCAAVDEYAAGLLAPHDPPLDAALRASESAGLPAIQVSPPQGKLLYLLARSIGARKHPGVRNARWLQHDLARAFANRGWSPDYPGGRPRLRGGCAREHRSGQLGKPCRPACRACT